MRLHHSVLCLALAALPAQAEDFTAQVTAKVESELRAWGTDPALIDAVKAANAAHADITQDQIDALDKAWRAETETATQPTIEAILALPQSRALLDKVERSRGMVSEVFVMDEHGLNVAQARATSDYWQGDEAKFQETYPKGPDAVHVSEVEFDESSDTYQVQASFTVNDPETGAPIGAMTVGLNAEMIE
ncbi:PDC sensor domain-containing protein [Rhodobacter lacus]|uniref:PDC sensor domain-containing protein n=1 Tax=Rhodobacter lacus TaxID=1641972 RepID=A0ABW5A775_9RHOB